MTTLSQNELTLKAPHGMTELVRGSDQRLIRLLAPLLREHSVTLDMDQVERIDAAGISALISLYGCARDAGTVFAISNARERVREILSLVNLDHILLSTDVVHPCPVEPCLEQSAA